MTPQERFGAKVCRHEGHGGCHIWKGATKPNGYGNFWDGERFWIAHRWSANARPGEVVLHTCDNPSCVNPDHLRVGTQQDNIRDALHKGRGRQKLTAQDVRRIRWAPDFFSDNDLASLYGVKPLAISRVRSRQSWAHVT